MQDNTAFPENTATESPPFLVFLKRKKWQNWVLFHTTDQPVFYSKDSFHPDPWISHQLEIPVY